MKDDVTYLVGERLTAAAPWEPFAEPVFSFLEQLSLRLRSIRNESHLFQELAAFGFWCRPAQLNYFRQQYADGSVRLGRGVTVHVPASNVPVLFGYSLVMGLLAGNACAIRLSDGSQEQDLRLCETLNSILAQPEQAEMRGRIAVFTCPKGHDAFQALLEQCDGIVAWGGDQTIQTLRSVPMRPDAVQLMFPNRYSICILDTEAIGRMEEPLLAELAYRFYRDTYAIDQNACSSPRFVIWGQPKEMKTAAEIRASWWAAVVQAASGYELTAHKATAKYEALCKAAMTLDEIVEIERSGNLLYTIMLSEIPSHPEQFQDSSSCGTFYQYQGDWHAALRRLAVRQLQTVTYYGIDKQDLVEFVVRNHLHGVLRVVPVGSAMDMDLTWDGQDVIAMLSRRIG